MRVKPAEKASFNLLVNFAVKCMNILTIHLKPVLMRYPPTTYPVKICQTDIDVF